MVLDKIRNIKNYNTYWKQGILKTISKEIDCSIHGITFGFIPNYGGQIQFSKDIGNKQKAITQIQFYVSLLDSVYTIQIIEIEETLEYHPLLQRIVPNQVLKETWVSPENHKYKDMFLKIQTTLETIIEKPIFLPYRIQQIELKNVKPQTMHDNDKFTVGDAFFKKFYLYINLIL